MNFRNFLLLLLLFLIYSASIYAQKNSLLTPSDTLNKTRLKWVVGAKSVGLGVAFAGLNELWYKNYPKDKFRFFNDNAEWLQLDKCGHAVAGYGVAQFSTNVFKWTGLEHKKSVLAGSGISMLLLTGIEILDGFSAQWGFSNGDMLANIAGVGVYGFQEYFWEEQKISIKVSYFPRGNDNYYASLRPNLLGSNWTEKWLKNYNAQTFWLSLNPHSILKLKNQKFSWLNIAFGYGGSGMLGGFDNVWEKEGIVYDYSSVRRYRSFYLSPDFDLNRIPTNKKWLKASLKTLNFIKIPMPAIELNEMGNFKAYWLYF
jgi:hypothetical protein